MNSNSLTLAVVDDHPFFREAAAKFLNLQGFTVMLEATNGLSLISQLETCPRLPDVCLLDIEMPVMDGYQTARHLRKMYPSMKIVACTLSPDEKKRGKILEAGADAVLAKESEPHLLTEAVMSLFM